MLALLLWAWGSCALLAQSTLQVVWENSDSELLLDSSGSVLDAGSSASGDGCVLQLGYYSNASAVDPFNGIFVPLTGEGSANTQFQSTTLGDSGAQAAGRFSLSTKFLVGSSTSGQNLPPAGTPLAIRFFNSSSIATSTYYNAVSAGAAWAWKTPVASPGELLLLSLGDSNLIWLGGAASAQRASLPSAIRFDNQPISVRLNPNGSTTLSVSVSGITPSFQWRKNGVNISGATAASYTLDAVQAGDAGSYDVLVTNIVGSSASNAAAVFVNAPVNIVTSPSSLTLNPGSLATFSVVASGTAPLAYQWRKDGQAIVGGTASSYTIASVGTLNAGSYDVVVSNMVNSSTSTAAALTVNTLVAPYFLSQPSDSRMIRATTATLALSAGAAPLGASDTWALMQIVSGGTNLAVASGSVSPSGSMSVSLRSVETSGDFLVRLLRTFSDGSTVTLDSGAFHLDVQTWDSVLGSYVALLLDDTHSVLDGAVYRGILNLTVSRSGIVSARLRFNEPLPVANAPDPSVRKYAPVSRSFAAVFTPVDGNPSLLRGVPKVIGDPAAIRETLVMELDCSTTTPTLRATVTYPVAQVFGGTPVAFSSVAASCPRVVSSLSQLPASMSDVAGRYLLAADGKQDGSGSNLAALLLQVLPSGRLLWTTRRPGYTGSGYTTLVVEGGTSFSGSVYEAQTTLVRSLSSQLVRSWMGEMQFTKSQQSVWRASVNSPEFPTSLESQSSCITWLGSVGSFSAANSNYGLVQPVTFSQKYGALWSLQSDISDFLRVPLPLQLVLQQPTQVLGTASESLAWNLSFSSAGAVSAERVPVGETIPGQMFLRVNRSTGEFYGTYIPNTQNARYKVFGIPLSPTDGFSARAIGWVETGTAPLVSTGTWSIKSR